jgi:RNA polymerase sigma-70 factor (ECF subfamily)
VGTPSVQLDFEALYTTHVSSVRRLLVRCGVPTADLDDVLQETFVIVHRLLPQFEGRAKIDTWLHAVAVRVASGYRRRVRTRRESSMGVQPESATEQGRVESIADEQLHLWLKSVTDEDRDTVALHEAGGLSISEMSELTGVARATVRLRLERGLGILKRRLLTIPSAPIRATPNDGAREVLGTARAAAGTRSESSVDYVDADCCLSLVDDLMIAVWRRTATTRGFEVLSEIMLPAVAHLPQGIRYLAVVEAGCKPPPREGRVVIGRLIAQLGPRLRAAAFGIECTGLLRLVPPIVNASAFLGAARINARYFSDVPTATTWLDQQAPNPGVLGVAAHIDEMRARISRHADRRLRA